MITERTALRVKTRAAQYQINAQLEGDAWTPTPQAVKGFPVEQASRPLAPKHFRPRYAGQEWEPLARGLGGGSTDPLWHGPPSPPLCSIATPTAAVLAAGADGFANLAHGHDDMDSQRPSGNHFLVSSSSERPSGNGVGFLGYGEAAMPTIPAPPPAASAPSARSSR